MLAMLVRPLANFAQDEDIDGEYFMRNSICRDVYKKTDRAAAAGNPGSQGL
jgi:hypothetical protein